MARPPHTTPSPHFCLQLFDAAQRLAQQPDAALVALLEFHTAAGEAAALWFRPCAGWAGWAGEPCWLPPCQCADSLRPLVAGGSLAPLCGRSRKRRLPTPCRLGDQRHAEGALRCALPAPVSGHCGECCTFCLLFITFCPVGLPHRPETSSGWHPLFVGALACSACRSVACSLLRWLACRRAAGTPPPGAVLSPPLRAWHPFLRPLPSPAPLCSMPTCPCNPASPCTGDRAHMPGAARPAAARGGRPCSSSSSAHHGGMSGLGGPGCRRPLSAHVPAAEPGTCSWVLQTCLLLCLASAARHPCNNSHSTCIFAFQ